MTKFCTLIGSLAAAIALPAAAQSSASLAVFEIEGTPAEQSDGMAWLDTGTQTLFGLVENLNTVAFDPDFSGVVLRLKDAALSTTQVEELSAAMALVRNNGKYIHILSDTYGPSDLLLAAASDGGVLQMGGMVSLPGMYMEEMFLADTLEWIGITAQLIQVGDYKGANEQMTRSEPSPEWDQNISGLLDSLYANQRDAIAEGYGFNNAQLDAAYEAGWWADGKSAVQAGLIAAEVDLPEIKPWLAKAYAVDSIEWVSNPYASTSHTLDTSNPFALFGQLMSPATAQRASEPTIAVLHINGTIVDGDSSSGGGLLGGGKSTGSRDIRNAIEKILKDDYIKGVVVRIDSPGGSAMASEVMWRGLERLKEKKPVWVSVGSMAASGGYYTLVAGQRVYVNPSSIVGSIGVVGGKYAMDKLYDKLKVHTVSRSRGPRAALMASSAPWNETEQGLIRTKMTETYNLFTSRVSAGRPGADLAKIAEGRLFTGQDAIALGMADEIGGLEVAITDMAAELEITPGAVLHYPAPPTLNEIIEQLLGGFVKSPRIGSTQGSILPLVTPMRELLGVSRFNAVVDQLNGMLLLRDEPVLLISPSALFIK